MTTVQDIQRQIQDAEQKRETAIRHENTRLKIQSGYQREIEAHNAEIAELRNQVREARLNESIQESAKLVRESDQENAALIAAATEAANSLQSLFGPLSFARTAYERSEQFVQSEADTYGSDSQSDPEDGATFKRESGKALQQMIGTATPITPHSLLVEWIAQSQGDRERAARQAIAYVLLDTIPAPTPDFSAREASALHLRNQRRQWNILGG